MFFVISFIAVIRVIIAMIQDRQNILRLGTNEENAPLVP